jgi:heme/copper-type cytochrome/quinol oxidase subunit 3
LTGKLSDAEKSMLFLLSADAIMALTIFAAFAYLRLRAPQWPAAFHFGSGLMAAAMTMFLLAGSFTMFLAVRAAHGPGADAQVPARWVAVTVASWGCFILLEGMEWVRLIVIIGVTLRSNPWNIPLFGASYFVLTGFHALHVIAGLAYLILVAAKRWDPKPALWYVHFVNAMWLPLFFGLYLASTDLQGL